MLDQQTHEYLSIIIISSVVWATLWTMIGFNVGEQKDNGFGGAVWGFLLGPIGVWIVHISKDSSLVPCEFCKEDTKRDATICPHCRTQLPERPPEQVYYS